MMDSTDMSTPVMRGELHDALGLFRQELGTEHQQALMTATAPLATKAELHTAIATATAPLSTKAELAAAIAPLATKAELAAAIAPLATKAELAAAIAPLATKTELEMWGGALLARIQQGEQRLGNLERGQEQLIGLVQQSQLQTGELIQQTERRLLAELARHASAIQETMRAEVKARTERFDDLPGRVGRLETEVFGPAPRGKRTRGRSH
jgi:hypothetical protein